MSLNVNMPTARDLFNAKKEKELRGKIPFEHIIEHIKNYANMAKQNGEIEFIVPRSTEIINNVQCYSNFAENYFLINNYLKPYNLKAVVAVNGLDLRVFIDKKTLESLHWR